MKRRARKYEDRVISMSEIDSADDTCCLTLHANPGSLVASIEAVGLINPPVLRENRDFKYRIVCGFRRVKACESIGLRKIKCRILLGDLSELDLLRLAILDNRSHRCLDAVEQARGIQKLSAHIQPTDRLQVVSFLLGFPPNQKVYDKLDNLSRLPEPVQAGVLDETVSLEAAALLGKLSAKISLCFLDVFKRLRLSQNKQTQVITLIQEIGKREDLEPEEVLQEKEVRTVMGRQDLNRNQKGSAIRAYLKRRRFPVLTEAERKFQRQRKALKLDECIHITPPPYFEGGPYTLRMDFKSMKDFDERRKALDAMAENPALKRLLEPVG